MAKTRDLGNLVDYIFVDGSGVVTIPNLSGSGGVTAVTAISDTANANGATISGSNLTLTPASGAYGGVLTNSTQTISGLKTFLGTTASDATGLGSELITTASGTNWSGTNLATTGYTHTNAGTNDFLNAAGSVVVGEIYLITITVSGYNGILASYFNGNSLQSYIANGTYTYYRKATTTQSIQFNGFAAFTGTVTASVKLVTSMSAVTTISNSAGTRSLEFRTNNNVGNTIIGKNSGAKIVTGTYNTVIGDSSLNSTDATNNIAIGYNSLTRATGSSSNISIGNNAMSNYISAISESSGSNVAIGHSALINGTGEQSVAIGNSALSSGGLYSTSVGTGSGNAGNYNTAIGYYALQYITASNNTALGAYAGRYYNGTNNNTGATNSIFIGYNTQALGNSQTNQIVIGDSAIGGGSNTTTIGNSSTTQTIIPSPLLLQNYLIVGLGNGNDANSVAVGRQALNGTQTGIRNVAIGYSTLGGTHSGSYDTAVGFSALSAATSGGNNTGIGAYAGSTITSGTNNIIISGNAATPGSIGITTGSHNTIIGQNITGLATSTANNVILADGQGNVKYQWDGTKTLLGQTGDVHIGSSTSSTLLGTYTKFKVVGDGSANAAAAQGSMFIAAGTTLGDTGISVNQGTSGGTMMLLASINTSTGTSTNSAVYIIRFYFDGNNTPTMTYLGGSSDFVTIGISASNTVTLSGSSSGNKSYAWYMNKFGA